MHARILFLLALTVAVPASVASVFLTAPAKPCFVAGGTAYEFADNRAANLTVRIDNQAAHPALRLQAVDDPAAADFVLVDDGAADTACTGVGRIMRIRLDNAARQPDLIVALSRAPAATKIYVHSAHYSVPEAAALFAALRQTAGDIASHPAVATRD
jgi:fructose-specific component phosphotransferase system IIB-like protein